jgi:hypothetical protein
MLPIAPHCWIDVCGQPEDSWIGPFRAFLKAYAVMGRLEIDLIYCRGQAEAKKYETKIPGATAEGALRENNFTPAWARRGSNFTSWEGRDEASQLLKGQSKIVQRC